MLVSVRFYSLIKRNIITISLLFVCFFQNALAYEKDLIINNLKNINSIKFNFTQKTNGINEKGQCLLMFPNKLKCEYEDKNLKVLTINRNRLAITQKRYEKTYYYPLSKSPFIEILNKNSLIELIKNSSLKKEKEKLNIHINNESNQKFIIIFDKENFDLAGWLIKDQFNNDIEFSIRIIEKNIKIKLGTFDISDVN